MFGVIERVVGMVDEGRAITAVFGEASDADGLRDL